MGKKKREESDAGVETSESLLQSKRPRKTVMKLDVVKEKPNKINNLSDKVKHEKAKGICEAGKKLIGNSDINKNLKSKKTYSDSSSSSDSESEKNYNKNEKKSVTESNSDSCSDSSDSDDSSPPSREELIEKNKSNTCKSQILVNQKKNSITNLTPARKYESPEKSSSSDSYHSDTEEEDKKRRKKQKKLLQMQLNKKAKKSSYPRTTEMKPEIISDGDEDGGDNLTSNNDGMYGNVYPVFLCIFYFLKPGLKFRLTTKFLKQYIVSKNCRHITSVFWLTCYRNSGFMEIICLSTFLLFKFKKNFRQASRY